MQWALEPEAGRSAYDVAAAGAQVVEQTIMASGLLLLTGAGVLLIVRDISHLGG